MIFDTHAHYDSAEFEEDRDALLTALPGQGVSAIVNVGASPDGARASAALARKYPFVYAAVGIHPDDAGSLDDALLEELRELSREEKCAAIGEIGLDYHWKVWPKEVQADAFVRQMKLAIEEDLPINVHSRDAARDTFELIRDNHAGTTGGIIHCYSGSPEMAAEYVKMGYMLGIGGVVTFKNAKVLKNVVKAVPIEHLVTETDCPYLAPVPYRGKRNDSTMIRFVIEEIARLREMDLRETEEILFENAMRVYRLRGLNPLQTQ